MYKGLLSSKDSMENNNFQHQFVSNFLQPIADKLKKIQKNPEITKFIQGIDSLVKNDEITSPIMDRLTDELANNPNFSEALENISYRQIYRIFTISEQMESVNLLSLINVDLFQNGMLECFDEVQIGNHFKKRKPLIAEAFKLYELGYFSGCLCLIHSQLEGIITDYLIFKNIIRKKISNGKTKFICNSDGKNVVGLARKIELAKDINENFLRLESFQFEPYRVCRRVNILRDYPDDKIKIYP